MIERNLIPSLATLAEQSAKELAIDLQRMEVYYRNRHEERLKEIESTRRAAMDLDAAGYEVGWDKWSQCRHITIDLGFFARTKAGRRLWAMEICKLRKVLGCRLVEGGTNAADGKKGTVRVTLHPKDFPSVTIYYNERVKPGKCKIITRVSRYTELVCEAPTRGGK